MSKSSYSDILEEFGVPKTTLWRTININIPPTEIFFYEAHARRHTSWKITSQIFRELIRLTTIKKGWDRNLPYQG